MVSFFLHLGIWNCPIRLTPFRHVMQMIIILFQNGKADIVNKQVPYSNYNPFRGRSTVRLTQSAFAPEAVALLISTQIEIEKARLSEFPTWQLNCNRNYFSKLLHYMYIEWTLSKSHTFRHSPCTAECRRSYRHETMTVNPSAADPPGSRRTTFIC